MLLLKMNRVQPINNLNLKKDLLVFLLFFILGQNAVKINFFNKFH